MDQDEKAKPLAIFSRENRIFFNIFHYKELYDAYMLALVNINARNTRFNRPDRGLEEVGSLSDAFGARADGGRTRVAAV